MSWPQRVFGSFEQRKSVFVTFKSLPISAFISAALEWPPRYSSLFMGEDTSEFKPGTL